MAEHKQPTKEELQEQERIAIEEADKIEKEGLPQPESEEVVIVEPEVEQPIEEESQEEEVIEESTPSEEEQREIDRLKKENSASSREAQKIYAKNRVINKALIEADEIPEPTEEDLVKEFGQEAWEVMSETERTFAKETVISRNWRKKISEAKEQSTKIEKWNDSVEEFTENPKTLVDNPELEGKTEEFKTFAMEESNNSVPFKILVSAFLHDHSSNKKVHRGAMFPTGSGGPNDRPQPSNGEISLDDARKLRETDYAKYKEYLMAGKIKSDL